MIEFILTVVFGIGLGWFFKPQIDIVVGKILKKIKDRKEIE